MEGINKLKALIAKIRRTSKSDYDCVVGVSGGVDSTYTLYLMKKMGLRPLAVHFDNGWNSDIAVQNIKNATNMTFNMGWQLFKIIDR